MPLLHLSQIDALEHEAIHILRETAAQFPRAAILFSGGKDSLVLAVLARKAFAPARPPFSLLHIDTGHNFPETLAFRDRFAGMVPEAGYAFLGAFREGRLAAFLSLLWVDDWVSIGPYAHGAFRQSCPTDGMVHLALAHFLQARGVRVLSYGLSSLQERGSRQGLHAFKTKVGFRAQPVRRCFVLHPPLAASWPRRGLQALLRQFPASRACRKAEGVLGLLDAACGAGDGDRGLDRPGRQA